MRLYAIVVPALVILSGSAVEANPDSEETSPHGNLIGVDGNENPGLTLSKIFRGDVVHIDVLTSETGVLNLRKPAGSIVGEATILEGRAFFQGILVDQTGWWEVRGTDGSLKSKFEVIAFDAGLSVGASQVMKASISQFDSINAEFLDHITSRKCFSLPVLSSLARSPPKNIRTPPNTRKRLVRNPGWQTWSLL